MTFDNAPAFMSMLLLTPDLFPPLSASATVEIGARSRAPAARHTNDDHYIVLRLGRSQEILLTSLPANLTKRFDEHAYGMVVADGMGSAGELASRLAITALMELAGCFGPGGGRGGGKEAAPSFPPPVHPFFPHRIPA